MTKSTITRIAAPVRLAQELLELLEAAVGRVDLLVVDDVVAVINSATRTPASARSRRSRGRCRSSGRRR